MRTEKGKNIRYVEPVNNQPVSSRIGTPCVRQHADVFLALGIDRVDSLAASPPACRNSNTFGGFAQGAVLLLVGALSAACGRPVRSHPGHRDVSYVTLSLAANAANLRVPRCFYNDITGLQQMYCLVRSMRPVVIL